MGPRFKKFFRVTKGFLVLRFIVSIIVSLVYIFVAAGIQFLFVSFFGENTFNYIVGGALSLFLGVLVCKAVGAILFMFIKGWHVAALAYVDKIEASGASAFDVGVRAFFKNLVSFGAVYGVRTLLRNVLADFKVKLWDISDEIPYGSTLRRFASHPITEYLAGDILHYAFDASIFYIVGHPPEELNEVPSTVLTAVKKYLYCIPSVLVSSVQTYLLFRFLPKLCKYILLLWVFMTEGLVAGVLITVLMFPLFYILDNSLFDPLTMMVFMATYSKKCDKEYDTSDPVVIAVERILNNEDTSSEGDEEEDTIPSAHASSGTRRKKDLDEGAQSTAGDDFVDIGEESPAPAPHTTTPQTTGQVVAAGASLQELTARLDAFRSMMGGPQEEAPVSAQAEQANVDVADLPIDDEELGEVTTAGSMISDVMARSLDEISKSASGFVPHVDQERPRNPFAVLRDHDAAGLDDDPLAGMYGKDDSGDTDV